MMMSFFYMHSHIHTHVHIHICMHAYVHTAYMHAYVCIYIHTHTHTLHMYIQHTYIHTYVYTYIHTHTQTHTHTHTRFGVQDFCAARTILIIRRMSIQSLMTRCPSLMMEIIGKWRSGGRESEPAGNSSHVNAEEQAGNESQT
jgi:hypothetical protein